MGVSALLKFLQTLPIAELVAQGVTLQQTNLLLREQNDHLSEQNTLLREQNQLLREQAAAKQ